MARLVWIGAVIVLLVVGVFALGFSRPSADADRASITGNVVVGSVLPAESAPLDSSVSTFSFIGYGPGKQHTGTFNDWDAELLVQDGSIVGFTGTIQAASVTTDSERVTTHLQTDAFFDVAQFPTITFASTGFDADTSMITGLLTFHGVTQEITFPVVRTDDSLSADFVLNTKPFNMKYEKITNEVAIAFTLVKA